MSDELKKRTKRFALNTIAVANSLPRGTAAGILGKQLVRAGTSVGANYRAACKARSPAEFIAKVGVVEEESDECCYWLELLLESKLTKDGRIELLHKEADELTAIMAASRKTASRGLRAKPRNVS
jgi:four helix bundle protein